MFRRLHHFNLIVSDKEKTKAFYQGLLGLEIALETEIGDDEFSRGVRLPGSKVLADLLQASEQWRRDRDVSMCSTPLEGRSRPSKKQVLPLIPSHRWKTQFYCECSAI